MGSDESGTSLIRVLVDRCSELEVSYASLKAQLEVLAKDEVATSPDDVFSFPGNFRCGGPYGHVLQSLDHAVHVTDPASGEITYWNHAAEKLYGWRDYEVLGQCSWEILIEEQYAPYMNRIMEKLRFGHSWSGQFPFKKRSGELFMALVTKSPLYEDGQLIGVVTVSSDAVVFNNLTSEQPRKPGFDRRRIQWPHRPQIASVPQMASSFSDLASRVLLGKVGDNIPDDREGSDFDFRDSNLHHHEDITRGASGGRDFQEEESVISQPAKIAAKLFAKLRKKSTTNKSEANYSSFMESGVLHRSEDDSCWPRGPKETVSHNSALDIGYSPFQGLRVDDELEADLEKHKAREIEDATERQVGVKTIPSSLESQASSSSGELNAMADSDIRWEDLHLGEEIGQGSYAVVYHGLWNGSDVAIKVYFGKDYNEGTLLGYKKEIGIMRKLRHPNVLLFMGACYSQERLAIVTEYLPRGSLFKILHKNNQILDRRRRLRMALDVARGMNYLHRRNPPIVHRDLKSSNLLVDKNWNVKVGDFGLSKLKNATYLTAKSGGGTPQWMAPEVLRNELSNEKSDIFSFGVILWELMTVSIPWSSLNSLQVVGVVGFMDRRLDIPETIDPSISSIIKDCWQSKPELRPSFQDIIQRMIGIIKSLDPPAPTPMPIRKSFALPS
ncbi:uncharacterized protein LOC141587289 isoform X2 [Silene latifolia]|uniref:uncharacterized protein LOC141587289 isoform X2 n=1 Tax=Silene latifolia TaxID=37657 RepID=UPI003D7840F7